jgi:S-layer homology domain
MTHSPTPTPNPNRRRRLTADELIAIVVALAGIGTVFFWGIGQKYRPLNLLQGGISNLNGDSANRKVGLLGSDEPLIRQPERQTIGGIAEKDRQNPPPMTTLPTQAPTTIIKTVEVEVPTAPKTTPDTVPVTIAPIITPTIVTPTAPTVPTPEFTDIPKQFWGETYITELQKRGILDDFGTGKFDPNQPITRGEYAKMLDRAFADKPKTTVASDFKDIPADYQRKEAIAKSVQLGFMTGYPSNRFAPNQQIPRYQLQISLAKGMQLKTPSSTDDVLSKFTDAKEMPAYARSKMAAAVDSGLTIKDTTKNLLKPMANATRADAAALIYEALVKEGKIKPQQQP